MRKSTKMEAGDAHEGHKVRHCCERWKSLGMRAARGASDKARPVSDHHPMNKDHPQRVGARWMRVKETRPVFMLAK
jgi:hypothetical protein